MKIKLNSAVSYYEDPVYIKDHPVMALTVLKRKIDGKYQGVVREIVSREGDVEKPGYVDRSILSLVESEDLLHWERISELKIEGLEKILERISKEGEDFLGLEDPDIIEENGNIHLYYTIPFKIGDNLYKVYIGHAEGSSLDKLTATMPVLSPSDDRTPGLFGFKEASFCPVNENGEMINLAESGYFNEKEGKGISIIVSSKTEDLGKNWWFMEKVFDPIEEGIEWIGEHASPGPILEKRLISRGDLCVGFVNGRSPSRLEGKERIYGDFRVGMMLVDHKTGKIPWISNEFLIEDPKAKTVTFSSDFIDIGNGKGILYAHVDDSFVRAYEIDLKELDKLIPKKK